MTEFCSRVNYEKHFLLGNLNLPNDVCNIIKDYCFYDVNTSAKIKFARKKKSDIVAYFQENMRMYDSVACYKCGEFQLIVKKEGGERNIVNIPYAMSCECGEYSLWLPYLQ